MKNIKKYLMLALSIAFSVSLHMFAMEPIGSNKSGESIRIEEGPIGSPSESTESGAEVQLNPQVQRLLKTKIETLRTIDKKLANILIHKSLSANKQDSIQRIQNNIKGLIKLMYDMYYGEKPTEMLYVNQQMELIELSSKQYL
jgi:hypothetical protein